MEEGEERKCGGRAAFVYRRRENKRIWEDKQEMKGIGRIKQQLERMVSGFLIAVCGVQCRTWHVCAQQSMHTCTSLFMSYVSVKLSKKKSDLIPSGDGET